MQWSIKSDRGSADAGQFATPDWVAELLCSRLRKAPQNAADLGVGKGALAMALVNRFPGVRLIGVDNYPIPKCIQADMRSEKMSLVTRDVSDGGFPSWFVRRYGRMDAVICNPPFTYLDNNSEISAAMAGVEIGAAQEAKYQRLDLVFLAHSLRMLKPGGEMAFILPISAFGMSRTFSNLQALSQHFGLREIIALPQSLYQDADVQTAILIFRPGISKELKKRFIVSSASHGRAVERIGSFSAAELIKEYDAMRGRVQTATSLTSLGAQIARGRHSSKELSHQGISHFHTTSFQNYPNSEIHFENGNQACTTMQVDAPAQEGDILIPRVGTRCLGRAAIVMGGSRYISDCVFRISVPASKRRDIWEFLSSGTGRDWQISLAHGACAKFITHQALAAAPFPVQIR